MIYHLETAMRSTSRASVFLLLLAGGFGCRHDALAPQPSAAAGPLFSQSNPPPPDPLAPPGHIVFVRILPPLDREVFRMDATGANVTELQGGYAPAPSPDGTKIAFNCGANICVMNADGSGVVHLTANVLAELPAWSPDGSRLAFNEQDPA